MNATCPGLGMPSDEWVACYRAGHTCPTYVAIRTETATHIRVSYRCPCCGTYGISMSTLREWGELPTVPENIRAGIVLDGAP